MEGVCVVESQTGARGETSLSSQGAEGEGGGLMRSQQAGGRCKRKGVLHDEGRRGRGRSQGMTLVRQSIQVVYRPLILSLGVGTTLSTRMKPSRGWNGRRR